MTMRIIAGEFRGHRIETLKSSQTRPTLDQVKESLFNALGQFFQGGLVLDLYAGSGNLGLEALSRGFDQAVFVDRYGPAIQVIQSNIARLGVQERAVVYKRDAMKVLPLLKEKGYRFDLILLDPPFQTQPFSDLLPLISTLDLLTDDGHVVCETAKDTVLEDRYLTLVKYREYVYGTTKLTIFQKEGVAIE